MSLQISGSILSVVVESVTVVVVSGKVVVVDGSGTVKASHVSGDPELIRKSNLETN